MATNTQAAYYNVQCGSFLKYSTWVKYTFNFYCKCVSVPNIGYWSPWLLIIDIVPGKNTSDIPTFNSRACCWPPIFQNSFHMTFFLLRPYQQLRDVGKVLVHLVVFVSLLLRAKMTQSYRERFAHCSFMIMEWFLDQANKRCFIYPAARNDFQQSTTSCLSLT